MFDVTHYKTKEVYKVYGVSETTQGIPMFLLYIDGEWVWKFANDYEPIDYFEKDLTRFSK